MSVRMMTAVWELKLPDSQKIVLLALADCANDEGLCWPSMATLASKCSKGQRTVQGVIKQLVDAGHLSREEVIGRGCRYIVHPRSDSTPAAIAPRSDRATPPQPLPDTPAAAADKPSENHQEPKEDGGSDDPLTPDDLVETWNEFAPQHGLPTVRGKLNKARRAQAKARIREYPDPADWARAFQCIAGAKWMHGDNDRGWRADFDFLIQAKSLPKLVEQSYGKN